MKYYSPIDDNGSPGSFWCPECTIHTLEGFIACKDKVALTDINPENSPFYQCQVCGTDYRDYFNSEKVKEIPHSLSHAISNYSTLNR